MVVALVMVALLFGVLIAEFLIRAGKTPDVAIGTGGGLFVLALIIAGVHYFLTGPSK
jgi:hypothetical protein